MTGSASKKREPRTTRSAGESPANPHGTKLIRPEAELFAIDALFVEQIASPAPQGAAGEMLAGAARQRAAK